MLFTAEGCEKYLSGAILDPETLYQKSDGGVLFPELLKSRGILPGVKPHLKIYEVRAYYGARALLWSEGLPPASASQPPHH
jgi:fructose-bisphosphate aldolase class I